MKILAVDDEKIALEGLVNAIREAEPFAEIYAFQKAGEALEFYRKHACEIAFLDIQMRSISGVEIAKALKLIHPKVNIIFATGYGDYREDAFEMHASGYLTKPITSKKIREELNYLRYPVAPVEKNRVRFCTFGNFEVFVEGKPVRFQYERTKEMLAYLVDRKGAYCSNEEIMAVLWQDEEHSGYLRRLRKDLLDVLRQRDCMEVIDTGRGKIRIDTEKVDCDYYDWCMGKPSAINQYRGEYMMQYSWAEFTNAVMSHAAIDNEKKRR